MSKISNQAAYPALLQPTLSDYLVITDYDNKLRTKTVSLNTVKNLFDVSYSDVTIEISSAELKALLATPKTLIAAPGVGKVLEVLSDLRFSSMPAFLRPAIKRLYMKPRARQAALMRKIHRRRKSRLRRRRWM